MKNTITNFIKSITRKEPEKSFLKAGFIDEQENVTEKGREALEFVLWEANKEALKKLADTVNEQDAKEA